ncbi:MAG: hypothetical protein HFH30_05440 [Eubacterium sp.]|nr:hypothetical protein [Eubacterium sp.]MCI8919846.1 hypothetical protein [Eubacterium sp.]
MIFQTRSRANFSNLFAFYEQNQTDTVSALPGIVEPACIYELGSRRFVTA